MTFGSKTLNFIKMTSWASSLKNYLPKNDICKAIVQNHCRIAACTSNPSGNYIRTPKTLTGKYNIGLGSITIYDNNFGQINCGFLDDLKVTLYNQSIYLSSII